MSKLYYRQEIKRILEQCMIDTTSSIVFDNDQQPVNTPIERLIAIKSMLLLMAEVDERLQEAETKEADK